jgi:SlyX protein
MTSVPGDSDAIADRFEIVESKILFQDRMIDELNEVVTKQQDQIDLLTTELNRLRQDLANIQEGGIDGVEEPPPPHY